MRASEFIVEVSDERLQSYLNQAGQQIDRRQTRMAQARERLNKGYEIYHAEDPTRTVHRFEANTPAEARRYYEKYNANYESDRDYDLKLRRSTGLMEDAFRGIDISMERDDDEIMVRASAGGKQLGSVLFVDSDGYLMPQDLEVNERYRGQGIAAAMYDYVKSQGYRIRRSGQQTDAGAGFWAKHRPDSNVWEQGVAEGTDDIKKTMSKLEALALAANRAGDDTKCKMYQQKIQSLKQKLSKDMSAGVTEVKIGPEITGRSLLFKAAAMAMRDAGREGITLDYDQAIKQASRIYGIPYQPSELPKLLAQRAEIDRQLALLKQGKQVAKQRRQEKRAPTPAGAEEYWRTHALPTDRIKPPTKTLEEMQETPPEVLRALDQAAQKNGYKNWADVKANPRSNRAVITVAKLANEIMKTTGPHHEKIFYKSKTDENFADGKVKGKSRPGRVKRAGASCNGSVTDLRARAKKASGEKAKMYHWCANMKSGKKKSK